MAQRGEGGRRGGAGGGGEGEGGFFSWGTSTDSRGWVAGALRRFRSTTEPYENVDKKYLSKLRKSRRWLGALMFLGRCEKYTPGASRCDQFVELLADCPINIKASLATDKILPAGSEYLELSRRTRCSYGKVLLEMGIEKIGSRPSLDVRRMMHDCPDAKAAKGDY